MFSIFALIAVLFSLIAVGGIIALGYIQVAKKNLKKGDLVRTRFIGSPTVLTTALFGLNAEYGSSQTYGLNYAEDVANALHCDMPSGVGLYSTWISDGGMNFKINPRYSNAPLYILGGTCTNDADCSKTTLKCGPGYINPDPSTVDNININPGGQSLWNNSVNPPYHLQCPGSSYCDICGAPPSTSGDTPQVGYCKKVGDTTSVGNCISREGIQWRCSEVYPGYPRACAANISVTPQTPPHTRFESCSLNQNFRSLSFQFIAENGQIAVESCSGPFGSISYFCTVDGNVNCLLGQQCVPNWGSGSETGWIPTPGTNNAYQVAQNVCSGTVFPMIVMQTEWIAEGKISSIEGENIYVDWNRVQNTYGGVGPSAQSCYSTTNTPLKCYPPTAKTANDKSWVYSDCRFVKMDDAVESRHLSVSNALLGTADAAPSGLDVFSVTDPLFTKNVLNLLHVATATTGFINNWFSNTSIAIPPHDEYRPTSWNLSNVYTKSDLERIFFYSIHAFQTSTVTNGYADENFDVVKNNLNVTYRH